MEGKSAFQTTSESPKCLPLTLAQAPTLDSKTHPSWWAPARQCPPTQEGTRGAGTRRARGTSRRALAASVHQRCCCRRVTGQKQAAVLQHGASAAPLQLQPRVRAVFPAVGRRGECPGSDYGAGGLARVFHSRLLQPIAAREAEQAFDILSASGEQR